MAALPAAQGLFKGRRFDSGLLQSGQNGSRFGEGTPERVGLQRPAAFQARHLPDRFRSPLALALGFGLPDRGDDCPDNLSIRAWFRAPSMRVVAAMHSAWNPSLPVSACSLGSFMILT